jgi:hypothetical protein
MARIIRSSKSASYWSDNELEAYRIQFVDQNEFAFFGLAEMPIPNIDIGFLFAIDAAAAEEQELGIETIRLLNKMEDAMDNTEGANEFAVNIFSLVLFESIGYTRQHKHLRAQLSLPFGMETVAKPDFCLRRANKLILFVQEDKAHLSGDDPQPQVVAEAIAAFKYNNALRSQLGMPQLDNDVIHAITMVGTRPTFYKVNTSIGLIDAVQNCTYPDDDTIIHPPVPPNGMEIPINRFIILSYLAAFRQSFLD